jgi:DNA-binding transcriptional LysR family regulator
MRSLNLDQLRAFVEVAERGSFTAAARQLNLTQPAVTHQVQELERRFKVALVERLGKRAHLTQAGEELIEHARHLLEEDNRTHVAMRRFDDGWLGRVRVGTSMTILMYLLPPILRRLKTEHPQLEIEHQHFADVEEQCARPGSVCPSYRGPGVSGNSPVYG